MLPKISMILTASQEFSLYCNWPWMWLKVAADPHDPKFLEIWEKEYYPLFLSFANKHWREARADDAEGMLVDMWSNVWLKAVQKWDGKRDFKKWVMLLFSNYLKTEQSRGYTEKGKGERATIGLEAPAESEEADDEEAFSPINYVAEDIGKIFDEVGDAEWLEDAVSKIEDDALREIVNIIIKQWNREKPGDTWEAMRNVYRKYNRNPTRDQIEKDLAADPGVQYILRDYLDPETGKPRGEGSERGEHGTAEAHTLF